MWFWITVPLDFIESQRPKWLVAGVATATAKGTGWGNASDWPLRGRHRGWDSTHLAVSGHQRCFSFQTLSKHTEYTVFWPVFFLKVQSHRYFSYRFLWSTVQFFAVSSFFCNDLTVFRSVCVCVICIWILSLREHFFIQLKSCIVGTFFRLFWD